MFGSMTEDKVLSDAINATLDRIFGGENIKKTEMLINEQTVQNIVSAYEKANIHKVQVKPLVDAVVAKYSGQLTDLTLQPFLAELQKTMLKARVTSPKTNAKIVENIGKMISETRTVTLTSVDKAIDSLKELARVIKTYELKVNQAFNLQF